jgi:HAD superfamily hydrolase (TIGR01459 family)
MAALFVLGPDETRPGNQANLGVDLGFSALYMPQAMTREPTPSRMSEPSPPAILEHARDLLGLYDVLFCDVWGVVHDGHNAYQTACDALLRFREAGGTVVLVSNAPVPGHRVASMLDLRKVPRDAWDTIVSSGGIALAHLEEKGYERVHYVGPRERDAAFFEKSQARPSPIGQSQALVCTGLNDDVNETPEDYRPLLEAAHASGLPFVCANPDLVVDVGGRLYPCAGALADLYERMGGPVFWAGKPHPVAYATAQAEAERIRGAAIARERVLVIGDAIRTDLAAAENAGLDALFIAAGIHRAEAMDDEGLSSEKLARLFTPGKPRALAAMSVLAW